MCVARVKSVSVVVNEPSCVEVVPARPQSNGQWKFGRWRSMSMLKVSKLGRTPIAEAEQFGVASDAKAENPTEGGSRSARPAGDKADQGRDEKIDATPRPRLRNPNKAWMFPSSPKHQAQRFPTRNTNSPSDSPSLNHEPEAAYAATHDPTSKKNAKERRQPSLSITPNQPPKPPQCPATTRKPLPPLPVLLLPSNP